MAAQRVHAFANMCRHRGVEVTTGNGNTSEFSCPYHGWLYDLTGKLIGAPYMKEAEGFDPRDCALRPLRADVWAGWIFVNFDLDAEPLAAFVADFAADFDLLRQEDCRLADKLVTAPERGQGCQAESKLWTCGDLARLMLEDKISGRSVVCEEKDQDRYGRIVAVCRSAGEDLNAWMVSRGWVLAYRRYAQDYVDEEADAKAARRGVWRGDFVPPWDWRQGKRLQSAARDTGRAMETNPGTPRVGNRSSGGCRVKGNISRDGTHIYHVPGGHYYERTKISTSKGERWFCSEAEAKSEGWRRSRR